jgi:hypothetical protein
MKTLLCGVTLRRATPIRNDRKSRDTILLCVGKYPLSRVHTNGKKRIRFCIRPIFYNTEKNRYKIIKKSD